MLQDPQTVLADYSMPPSVSAGYNPEIDFIHHLRAEASAYRARRHSFQNYKLTLVSALLGLGGAKIAFIDSKPAELVATLFFAPFVAAIYDMFIFAEDHKTHRALGFLSHYLRNKKNDDPAIVAFQQWDRWHDIYKESSARYYGSALISVISMVPAIVAYFLSIEELGNTESWPALLFSQLPFLLWILLATGLIALVFTHSKRRYNLMVEDPEDIHCPVGGWLRRLESWARHRFNRPRNFVYIVPLNDAEGRRSFEDGLFFIKERVPAVVRHEIKYVALYEAVKEDEVTQKFVTRYATIDRIKDIVPSDEEGKYWIRRSGTGKAEDADIRPQIDDDESLMPRPEMERPWYAPEKLFLLARNQNGSLGQLRRWYVKHEGMAHGIVWLGLPFFCTVVFALVIVFRYAA